MPKDYLFPTGEATGWLRKTADFMASAGARYLVDCTSGPVSMTLPDGMATGAGVIAKDAAFSWGTHSFTIVPAASGLAMKVNGSTAHFVTQIAGDELNLVANNTGFGIALTGSTKDLVRS